MGKVKDKEHLKIEWLVKEGPDTNNRLNSE